MTLRSYRARGLGLAAGCTAALVALCLLAVRTAWGQRIDAAAVTGRATLRPRAVHAAARLLTTIDVASLAMLGGAIVLVALARARPRLALGAGFVILGATVTTELLKRVVLTRPALGIHDAVASRNTFPSGHTTVAMSLATGALLVAPGRLRGPVALGGAAYAAAIGVATVATANHRPSDPIGAVLVVLAWAGLVIAALAERDGGSGGSSRGVALLGPVLALVGLALLLVAFVGLVTTVVAIRRDRLDTIELGGAFFGAATAITGTVLLALAALLGVLRGVTLDPPLSEGDADRSRVGGRGC